MAGHSHFANIKHKKGAKDAQKAQKFTILWRQIRVAAKKGQDPAGNPELRKVIALAKKAGLGIGKIQDAIKVSQSADDNYEEITYEAYGPHGVAFIIIALTDNRNRTAGEIRSLLTKGGGKLAETGSVQFLFERVGIISYKDVQFDLLLEKSLEYGALDVAQEGDTTCVTCEVKDFHYVSESLTDSFGEPESAEITWRPKELVDASEHNSSLSKLISNLEENDDVDKVFTNCQH